jgi:hypothetical protein
VVAAEHLKTTVATFGTLLQIVTTKIVLHRGHFERTVMCIVDDGLTALKAGLCVAGWASDLGFVVAELARGHESIAGIVGAEQGHGGVVDVNALLVGVVVGIIEKTFG